MRESGELSYNRIIFLRFEIVVTACVCVFLFGLLFSCLHEYSPLILLLVTPFPPFSGTLSRSQLHPNSTFLINCVWWDGARGISLSPSLVLFELILCMQFSWESGARAFRHFQFGFSSQHRKTLICDIASSVNALQPTQAHAHNLLSLSFPLFFLVNFWPLSNTPSWLFPFLFLWCYMKCSDMVFWWHACVYRDITVDSKFIRSFRNSSSDIHFQFRNLLTQCVEKYALFIEVAYLIWVTLTNWN